MTDKKDLKRRIRERMTKTGEAYTAARQHVLDARDEPPAPEPPPAANPPFEVVEPLALDELAASLGYKCGVRMFPGIAKHVTPGAVLTTLRDALLATEGDESTRIVRSVAFRGEVLQTSGEVHRGNADVLRQYLERVRAGIAGPSPAGTMLAISVEGSMVLVIASRSRATAGSSSQPLLWLHSPFESLGTHKVAGLLVR